ncbi:MAG: NnrS family protein [Arenicellales bacterium]|nr:NnrS family protein [Arenicellales bacterium]
MDYPLFRLGFRPFFLLAAIFSCISMLIWTWLYLYDTQLLLAGLTTPVWHAHEMIFGYAFGVIAGFLLTAVRNWTDIRTVHGTPLAVLTLIWLTARFLLLLFEHPDVLTLAMVSDGLFGVLLVGCLAVPIIQAKQWKQMGILILVSLIVLANALFYWGAINGSSEQMYRGIHLGLYLVVGLIMIIGGRVIPGFVERGVDVRTTVRRFTWVNKANFILFVLFIVFEVFLGSAATTFFLSTALFFVNAIRIWGWHNKGIWKVPLLWVLYLAYAFVVVGFALKSLSFWISLLPYLSMHAFAYGGIGMMTLGMMARVSLGHTGRNVYAPPAPLRWVFAILLSGAIVRVLLPLIDMSHYPWWIALSQIAWILAFTVFVFIYLPVLTKARIDGRDG